MMEWFNRLTTANKIAVVAIIVPVIVAVVGGIIKLIINLIKKPKSGPVGSVTTSAPDSPIQSHVGDGQTTQRLNIDKHTTIVAQPGSTINVYNYQDGLSQAPIVQVKDAFEQGCKYFTAKQFDKAIEEFTLGIKYEKDDEKLGALNLQIGNCYYEQRSFLKAADFYNSALTHASRANDKQGQASALGSLANIYMLRTAPDGPARGRNVQQAVEYYKKSLRIFTLRKYPIDYATTQNNLGNAYTDLPAETPQQRAENVRKAIDCYKAALEIYKKDEYPQSYCFAAANMGMILAEIQDKSACYWLKEAYSLKQFLPDQGRRLEELMSDICD